MAMPHGLLRTALLIGGLSAPVATAAEGPALDLAGYRMTFGEEFDSLDVSARGPGTRWIAHTPWNGDFGDARFTDPRPGFPFTTKDGLLTIEMRKGNDGQWRSGLLAAVDPQGRGFSQKFGYFEMRARFPAGEGVWPAFWLVGLDRTTHTSEIDIVEHYGHAPGRYTASVHVWDRQDKTRHRTVHARVPVPEGALSAGFHTYGALVEPDVIRFYFDRREVAKVPTPPEHRQPMYPLVDLGLGAGWPIGNTPNPSLMLVDYVRVWARE